MKLYLIGGLGADERVFKYLKLSCETKPIIWIDTKKNENIGSYAKRILTQIDQNEKFGLLGVIFGGLLAIELSKLCNPEKLIIVSSVNSKEQLSKLYISIGKMKILSLIPDSLIKPPLVFLGFLFGTRNTKLLNEIIRDTKPTFIRWA